MGNRGYIRIDYVKRTAELRKESMDLKKVKECIAKSHRDMIELLRARYKSYWKKVFERRMKEGIATAPYCYRQGIT